MRYLAILAVAFLLAFPVSGHHSDAGLDMDSLVTLRGTVTAFSWRNPHIYFSVETIDERGEPLEWAVQMSSTNTMLRMGWTRDSLVIGDRVEVRAHPSRDGRPYGLLNSIQKEGGVVLPTAYDSDSADPVLSRPEVTPRSDSLEGIWMADGSELVSFPGGFDGFFRFQLELTEKGAAAQAAYDEFSDENPESSCVGRPTPAMIVSTNLYAIQIEIDEAEQIVWIRSEFWDEERAVYMDGREHPGESERFPSGHSIGRWEGETLMVDTRNFADHRSPYQMGLPSGAQKHVVERYRLNEDGTRIVVEFVLEDPEYIVQPLTHRRELIYSPHLEFYRFDCDPQVTRRFVPDQ